MRGYGPEITDSFRLRKYRSTAKTQSLLKASDLVRKLTASFETKPLYAIWRIIALSEIPYAVTLTYTHQVIECALDFVNGKRTKDGYWKTIMRIRRMGMSLLIWPIS